MKIKKSAGCGLAVKSSLNPGRWPIIGSVLQHQCLAGWVSYESVPKPIELAIWHEGSEAWQPRKKQWLLAQHLLRKPSASIRGTFGLSFHSLNTAAVAFSDFN